MKKLKTLAVAMALSVVSFATINSASAYIPVIDPTAVAQQVQSVTNQISQIKQLASQIQAVTGNGNYAGLISNPSIRSQLNKYLPAQYTDVMQAVRAGDTSTLNGLIAKEQAAEKQAQSSQTAQQRAAAAQALQQVQLDVSMDRLKTHANAMATLVNQMNSTTDIAQKQDLSNAITAQSAVMQNEIAMAQLSMQRMQREEDNANAQMGNQLLQNVVKQQDTYINNRVGSTANKNFYSTVFK